MEAKRVFNKKNEPIIFIILWPCIFYYCYFPHPFFYGQTTGTSFDKIFFSVFSFIQISKSVITLIENYSHPKTIDK